MSSQGVKFMSDDFEIMLGEVPDQEDDFKPMPAGNYELVANKWEKRTSKAGNAMVEIEFQVLGPSHSNRKLWEYFTLEGNAVTVTARKIKAWRKALGLSPDVTFNAEVLDEMINNPFQAKIKIEPGTNGYEDSNKIQDYLAKGSSSEEEAPAAKPLQEEDDAMPWDK